MAEKIKLADLMAAKQAQRPIAMLTCYDAPTATLLQDAGVDSLLVGDSLAQVILGHDSTIHATMDIMVAITAAVRRGAPKVYLIGDMPFLSYQTSPEEALRNAGRFLTEAGCDAVKVEVDSRQIDTVARLAAAGIPVMAHLGYRPQSALGTTRVVGTRDAEVARTLVEDALALDRAGAALLLLECVTVQAAQAVTERTAKPVISCGSGAACDGQVLVLQEVMGAPGAAGLRFCKAYTDLASPMKRAAREYVEEIRSRTFPDREHSFHMLADEADRFERYLGDLPANA